MKRTTVWGFGLLLVMTCRVGMPGQASAAKPEVVEVSFELVRGAIVVPARVNGAGPFWMMLDTGADPSVWNLRPRRALC